MRLMPTLALVLVALAGAASAQDQTPAQKPVAAEQDQPVKPVYDEAANGAEQIAEALERAKKENRRVLLQWGGNWCGWCIKLHNLCRDNPELSRKLLYEYEVVHVDIGDGTKHTELVEKYGATLDEGVPYLTILDAEGRPLANQETGSLENEPGAAESHNVEKVMAFLTEHQAQYQSATAILDKGLARAKAEGKAAFVHFGAPWCGWCHRLEGFLAREDMAPIFEEHFIDIKIDTDRTIGGGDMLVDMRGTQQGGIPWFVFLDGGGEPVATSSDSGQNIGFPVAPEEIAAFMVMLREVEPAFTDEELAEVEAALREKKE